MAAKAQVKVLNLNAVKRAINAEDGVTAVSAFLCLTNTSDFALPFSDIMHRRFKGVTSNNALNCFSLREGGVAYNSHIKIISLMLRFIYGKSMSRKDILNAAGELHEEYLQSFLDENPHIRAIYERKSV